MTDREWLFLNEMSLECNFTRAVKELDALLAEERKSKMKVIVNVYQFGDYLGVLDCEGEIKQFGDGATIFEDDREAEDAISLFKKTCPKNNRDGWEFVKEAI